VNNFKKIIDGITQNSPKRWRDMRSFWSAQVLLRFLPYHRSGWRRFQVFLRMLRVNQKAAEDCRTPKRWRDFFVLQFFHTFDYEDDSEGYFVSTI
jgi:hypothetical protein